jgi:hypothetical protein
MSAETKPTGPATAALQPSPELVNGLLRWPEELRLDLARLLLDSVKEGFTSLEEAGQRDKDVIRDRIERARSGVDPTYDAFEVIAEMRTRLAERRRQ